MPNSPIETITVGSTTYDITDSAARTQLSYLSNENLLDNWYFVGGGSQLGDGKFPINQKAVNLYKAEGNTIDRWVFSRKNATDGNLAVASTNIGIGAPSTGYNILFQKIEEGTKLSLLGRVVTFSILVGNSLYSKSVTIPSELPTTEPYFMEDIYTSTGRKIQINADANGILYFGMVCFSTGTGGYGNIKAVKLELGSVQTLAHQENGIWVVNSVPNYQTELLKCQRYQLVFKTGNSTIKLVGSGYIQPLTDTKVGRIKVQTPVEMRTIPTIKSFDEVTTTVTNYVSGACGLMTSSGTSSITSFSSLWGTDIGGFYVTANIDSAASVTGYSYAVLRLEQNQVIVVDANL